MNSTAHLAEFILPTTDMSIGGARVHSTRFPNGVVSASRTILCIPGYAATGESFARLRPLAGAYDLRLLTFPEDGWRHADPIDYFAGIVEEFAHHFDHPVLLGTSFGGLVAINAARRLGPRVSGLTLISAFARLPHGRRLPRFSWMLPLLESLASHAPWFAQNMMGGRHIDEAAARELQRESRGINRREKRARFLAILGADLRESARRIDIPALIIHGSDDRLLPVEVGRALAALMPHAELVVIEKAGHLPYLTHPAEVNTALSRFLAHAFEVEHHAAAR